MLEDYYYDQQFKSNFFEKIDRFNKIEFECCQFNGCNFSNKDLSTVVFIECEFIECDFTNTKSYQTAFRDVHFKGCKLMGYDFSQCHDFLLKVEFDSCILDIAIFEKISLKNTSLLNCSIKDVDFSNTDLSGCDFSGSDLLNSVFNQTNLTKASFVGAINYSIDPEINTITKASFDYPGLLGLLQKYDINVH